MNNSTSNEVNKTQTFEPTWTPNPGSTDRIYDCCDVEWIDNMSSEMTSLSHWRILYLHTNQTKSKRYNPPCIIHRFKVLSYSFTIPNNTTCCLSWEPKSNQIKDEICYTHIHSIPIYYKLAIMRSCGRSLYQCIAYIRYTDPYTANEIKKKINTFIRLWKGII